MVFLILPLPFRADGSLEILRRYGYEDYKSRMN